MPGVVLHANITSQILSASLDRRPLIRTLEESLEWIWIISWTGLGVVIIWQFKSTSAIALSLLLISGGLVGTCYLAFIVMGWWLPVMPSLFSLLTATITLLVVTNKQRDRLQFQLTLALLLETYQVEPSTGHIAIEYLKQSESQDNQNFIEQQMEIGEEGEEGEDKREEKI